MKPFRLSGELDLRLKVKFQLKLIIPLTPWPWVAWEKSYWWTLLKWETGRVFRWDFWWPPAPPCPFPTWVGSTSKTSPRPLRARVRVERSVWVEVLPSVSAQIHQIVRKASFNWECCLKTVHYIRGSCILMRMAIWPWSWKRYWWHWLKFSVSTWYPDTYHCRETLNPRKWLG